MKGYNTLSQYEIFQDGVPVLDDIRMISWSIPNRAKSEIIWPLKYLLSPLVEDIIFPCERNLSEPFLRNVSQCVLVVAEVSPERID